MSRDILIEKIRSNTEFKLRFTSPSIEELASSLKEWLQVYDNPQGTRVITCLIF